MTQQNLTKLGVYAVEQEPANITLSKVGVYAVEQEPPDIALNKLGAYAVLQNSYGAVYQDTSGDRPVYRDAPSGGIPYIDMSATGAALKVDMPYADNFTMIVYNADQTFTVTEVEFTAGANTLAITEDFNQIVALKGHNLHRFTIDAVKEGMKARV